MVSKFPNRNRLISTPRLNILLCLHLVPISAHQLWHHCIVFLLFSLLNINYHQKLNLVTNFILQQKHNAKVGVRMYVIISHGPQTIPNLEVCFTLRCFQSLSFPDLATLRCPWQDSRHTRGQFTPVLSSLNPLLLGV